MQQANDYGKLIQDAIDYINSAMGVYGPILLGALLTFVFGWLIIGYIVRIVHKTATKRNFDPTLTSFLLSFLNIGLKVLLLLTVVNILGVETTSFVAVIAAAGFAVGLALQGSLSNFSGGVLIILFKPFKVGDYIEAQGFGGSVKQIQIFHTILASGDNRKIIIPNGALSNSSIVNYSVNPTRRMDLTFGIGYDDDFEEAKKIINGIIEKHEMILKDPAPLVRVNNLGPSTVDVLTRIWVERANYLTVFQDMLETVKKEFDANNISLPFPQQDVNLYQRK